MLRAFLNWCVAEKIIRKNPAAAMVEIAGLLGNIWIGSVKGGDLNAGGVGRTLSWTKAVKSGLFET